eukprot:TRINITY_DN7863_c0_g1_i1.p1 TRINITY_DN7863_c0_g1~~TRINITY_DN7863_c0_g1_i1.p1  ORF type:complete len:1278 (+),score=562.24 TRINITY_DN7863_c0_g1_i1:85-3918(+)
MSTPTDETQLNIPVVSGKRGKKMVDWLESVQKHSGESAGAAMLGKKERQSVKALKNAKRVQVTANTFKGLEKQAEQTVLGSSPRNGSPNVPSAKSLSLLLNGEKMEETERHESNPPETKGEEACEETLQEDSSNDHSDGSDVFSMDLMTGHEDEIDYESKRLHVKIVDEVYQRAKKVSGLAQKLATSPLAHTRSATSIPQGIASSVADYDRERMNASSPSLAVQQRHGGLTKSTRGVAVSSGSKISSHLDRAILELTESAEQADTTNGQAGPQICSDTNQAEAQSVSSTLGLDLDSLDLDAISDRLASARSLPAWSEADAAPEAGLEVQQALDKAQSDHSQLVAEFGIEKQALNDKVTHLEAELEAAKKRLQTAQEESAQNKLLLTDQKQICQDKESEIINLQSEIESAKRDHQMELQEMRTSFDEEIAEKSQVLAMELEEERSRGKEDLHQLSTQLREAQQTADYLQRQYDEEKLSRMEHEDKCMELEGSLSESSQQCDSLAAEVSTLAAEAASLQTNVELLTSQVTSLETSLELAEASITNMTLKHEDETAECIRQHNAALEAEIANQEVIRAALVSEMQELHQNELRVLRHEAESERQSQSSTSERFSLIEQQQQEEISAKNEAIASLEAQLQEIQSEIVSQRNAGEKHLEEIKETLELQWESKLAAAQDELNGAIESENAIAERLAQANCDNGQLNSELSAAQDEIASHKIRIDELESEKASLSSELNDLNSELASLQQQLSSLIESHAIEQDSLSQDLEGCYANIAQLEKDKSELESAMAEEKDMMAQQHLEQLAFEIDVERKQHEAEIEQLKLRFQSDTGVLEDKHDREVNQLKNEILLWKTKATHDTGSKLNSGLILGPQSAETVQQFTFSSSDNNAEFDISSEEYTQTIVTTETKIIQVSGESGKNVDQELSELQSKNAELMSRLKKKEQDLDNLVQQLDSENTLLRNALDKVRELDDDLHTKDSDLVRLRAMITSLQDESSNNQNKEEFVKAKFNKLAEEFQSQKELLDEITSRLNTFELENAQLKDKLESEKFNSANILNLLEQEKEARSNDLQHRDERVQELLQKQMSLEKVVEKYDEQINVLETKIFIFGENEKQLRYKENETNQKLEETKNSLEQLQKSKKVIESQKEELNLTATHLSHQFNASKETIKDLDRKLKKEQSMVMKYVKELQIEKESFFILKAELDNLLAATRAQNTPSEHDQDAVDNEEPRELVATNATKSGIWSKILPIVHVGIPLLIYFKRNPQAAYYLLSGEFIGQALSRNH